MFCNNCGKEVNEDSVFCNYCGNCLKSIEAKQESTKPSLKEEIKAAWKSGPEKAE
ncbi:MAG: zinc-ribbon domain-containing protein, partial [Clostridia bacterium]|nr:zinc-ribbon domain-containing protein [Clostridia bacterium]